MKRSTLMLYCYFWLVIGLYSFSIADGWFGPTAIIFSFLILLRANTKTTEEK
jgi:hypothetical protein